MRRILSGRGSGRSSAMEGSVPDPPPSASKALESNEANGSKIDGART